MNYNNLAQKTNFIAGSNSLELTSYFLTSVNIPGMSFSFPEFGGRNGTKLYAGNDNVTFNGLSLELLIDEDFEIYHEFMEKINNSINLNNGTFADISFDFWVQINNNKGNKLFKIEFNECRIESIGDIDLNTQDDSTEHSLPIEIRYDYYNIVRNS